MKRVKKKNLTLQIKLTDYALQRLLAMLKKIDVCAEMKIPFRCTFFDEFGEKSHLNVYSSLLPLFLST